MLTAPTARSGEPGGWNLAFREAGLPSPDSMPVNFADQEMSFAWRSHFVAACGAPLIDAAREVAEAKGWTLFELPDDVADGVPSDMVLMFRGAV